MASKDQKSEYVYETIEQPLIADEPPPDGDRKILGILDIPYAEDDPATLSCYIGYQAVMFILGWLSGGIFFYIGALTPFCFSCCCEDEPPVGMTNNCCDCARSYPKHRQDQYFWIGNVVMSLLQFFGVSLFGGTHAEQVAEGVASGYTALFANGP